MKGEDNISDKYLKQVDEYLDNQSGQNYYNSLSQEESDEIWEKISVEMDIDEVWSNISSDLEIIMPPDSGSGIIFKSIAAVLIIFIGMIPVKKVIQDSGINKQDILIETKQNEQPANLIINNIPGDLNITEEVNGEMSSTSGGSLYKIEEAARLIPALSEGTGLTHETPIPLTNGEVSMVLITSDMADSDLVASRIYNSG